MYRLNMSLKTTLLCSLIITLITRKLDSFMYRLNMSLKITLCCSLIITLITRIPDTIMFRLNMSLKITLLEFCSSFHRDVSFLVFVIVASPLCLIVTGVTLENCVTVLCRYVTLKTTLLCSLIITLITRILDTFMFRLNMFLKTTLLCSLIITLITRILDSLVFRSEMS